MSQRQARELVRLHNQAIDNAVNDALDVNR